MTSQAIHRYMGCSRTLLFAKNDFKGFLSLSVFFIIFFLLYGSLVTVIGLILQQTSLYDTFVTDTIYAVFLSELVFSLMFSQLYFYILSTFLSKKTSIYESFKRLGHYRYFSFLIFMIIFLGQNLLGNSVFIVGQDAIYWGALFLYWCFSFFSVSALLFFYIL